MTTPAQDDDGCVTFFMDTITGESRPAPKAPDMALVAELLGDARAAHAGLVLREANVVDRQYRVAQLWLAAVGLCSAAGLFGARPVDLWLALGFAVGFGVSVLLIGPQRGTLAGIGLLDFNDPYPLGEPVATRLVLLSTWEEVIKRSTSAIEARVRRFAISVWLLAAFMPLAILARLVVRL